MTSSNYSQIILFPYHSPVVQVKLKREWLIDAERHAKILAEQSGKFPSQWAISTRACDFALLSFCIAKSMLLSPVMPVAGSYLGSIPLTNGRSITVSGCPANENYNLGTNASLSISDRALGVANIFVAGIYDPPFVDLIGWATPDLIRSFPVLKGRRSVPESALRSMGELSR